MRAGRLRHQVIIQTPTETVDAEGQAVKSWGTFLTVQAAVEPLGGREYFAAQQYNAATTTKITVRYQDGITAKMRVSYDSKIYNIENVRNVGERDRMIELLCSEGVNDG